MADPICRWRNPYLDTVIELISLLPKEEQSQETAREFITASSPYDFFRTPYQLACQLGLYHETNNSYFPKFNYDPTEDEVRRYLENSFRGIASIKKYSKISFYRLIIK